MATSLGGITATTDEFSDLAISREQLHETIEPNTDSISGFTDYGPAEHRAFGRLRESAIDAFKLYGFTDFYPRPLERAANLLYKGGVSKQIFGVSRLSDGSLTTLGIPFDRTVPLAIFAAKHQTEIVFPYKRFQVDNSFRGEHASPGRFRAFYQADVDILGPRLSLMNDFECLGSFMQAFKNMEIGPFKMFLNHIVIAKSMIAQAGIPKEQEADTLRIIDKLDKLPPEDVIEQVCFLVPDLPRSDIEGLVKKFQFRSSPDEFELDASFPSETHQAVKDVQQIYRMLVEAGCDPESLKLSPGMVRGLDYYTGLVFETFLDGLEQYGSIASGGRYDKLVDGFAKKETGIEGVGGSIGLTRLFYILSEEGRVPLTRQTLAEILVCFRTQELAEHAGLVASKLRSHGVPTSLYSGPSKKIGKQLDYANKSGFPFAVMVMQKDAIVVKDLNAPKEDKKQIEVESVSAVWDAYIGLSEPKL